jgi:hypothetical protein
MINKITALATGALLFGAALAYADDATTKADAAKSAVKDPPCLTQTGTRIPAKRKECVAFGRSYTQDQIRTTGATTAAAALRLLDPSITVHR